MQQELPALGPQASLWQPPEVLKKVPAQEELSWELPQVLGPGLPPGSRLAQACFQQALSWLELLLEF